MLYSKFDMLYSMTWALAVKPDIPSRAYPAKHIVVSMYLIELRSRASLMPAAHAGVHDVSPRHVDLHFSPSCL